MTAVTEGSIARNTWIFIAVCLMAASAGCSGAPPDADDSRYVATGARARAQKDVAFQAGSDSPVPKALRGELLPLAYFPIDPSYRVPAVLKVSEDPTILSMPTSTGGQRQMKRAGTLEFAVKGRPLALTALVESAGSGPDRLFVPFTDLTSGAETYPGGRYLDLDRDLTGIHIVDFNRAYHPIAIAAIRRRTAPGLRRRIASRFRFALVSGSGNPSSSLLPVGAKARVRHSLPRLLARVNRWDTLPVPSTSCSLSGMWV
jgi:uncharacterized protein